MNSHHDFITYNSLGVIEGDIAYIDNIMVIIKDKFPEYIVQIRIISFKLNITGLKVGAYKNTFGLNTFLPRL